MMCELSIQKIKGKSSYSVECSKTLCNINNEKNPIKIKVLRLTAEFIESNIDFNILKTKAYKILSSLEDKAREFQLRELNEIGCITQEVVNDAIDLGIAVIIRNEFNLAIDKLSRREISISTSDYLEF